MTTLESRCLESFPAWLSTLGEDARALTGLLEGEGAEGTRRVAAGALVYLFKSVDLVPDGLEELGFLDDAFVLRAAAARVDADTRALDTSGTLARLAEDAALIGEFLGADYERLEVYVDRLESGSVRGRSVAQILEDAEARASFVNDVRAWIEGYTPPTFHRDEKNLVKLRAFFKTRLAASAPEKAPSAPEEAASAPEEAPSTPEEGV